MPLLNSIATPYAEALLQVAESRKETDEVAEQVKDLLAIWKDSAVLREAMVKSGKFSLEVLVGGVPLTELVTESGTHYVVRPALSPQPDAARARLGLRKQRQMLASALTQAHSDSSCCCRRRASTRPSPTTSPSARRTRTARCTTRRGPSRPILCE